MCDCDNGWYLNDFRWPLIMSLDPFVSCQISQLQLLIDQQLVINNLLIHLTVSVWMLAIVKFYHNVKGLSN